MRNPKHEPEALKVPWSYVELWIEKPLSKALEAVDACWRAELVSSSQSQRFREARAALLSALGAVEETRRLLYWLYPGTVTASYQKDETTRERKKAKPNTTERPASAPLRGNGTASRTAKEVSAGKAIRPSLAANRRPRR